MPLKGVLLATLPGAAIDRFMVDIDLLIAPAPVEAVERGLRASALDVSHRSPEADTWIDPETRMEVDVHRELFAPGMFRMPAVEVVGRATPDESRFGAPVLLPDSRDLYAHQVGTFVRGRSNAQDRRRLRDLALVARTHRLDPSELAEHLQRCGLARAARYVLRVAAAEGDAFAAEVRARLVPDATGDVLATIASALLERVAGNHPLAVFPAHLLNHGLAAGAHSFSSHLARGAGRRMSQRLMHALRR